QEEILERGQMDTADNQLIGEGQQFAYRASVRGAHINLEIELPVPAGLDQRVSGRAMLLGDEDARSTCGRCGVREVQNQPLSHRVGGRPQTAGSVLYRAVKPRPSGIESQGGGRCQLKPTIQAMLVCPVLGAAWLCNLKTGRNKSDGEFIRPSV